MDFLRDTPARLLGYANEVGEGLRPVMPRLVAPSYAVAIAYVAADTVHKYDIARRGKGPLNSKGERASPAVAAADTLVWQLLASVAVPGFIINRAVWFAGKGVEASARLPPGLPLRSLLALPAVRKWLPTVAGIALIPFIVEPVDKCEAAPPAAPAEPEHAPRPSPALRPLLRPARTPQSCTGSSTGRCVRGCTCRCTSCGRATSTTTMPSRLPRLCCVPAGPAAAPNIDGRALSQRSAHHRPRARPAGTGTCVLCCWLGLHSRPAAPPAHGRRRSLRHGSRGAVPAAEGLLRRLRRHASA